jgi:hypothetical protein
VSSFQLSSACHLDTWTFSQSRQQSCRRELSQGTRQPPFLNPTPTHDPSPLIKGEQYTLFPQNATRTPQPNPRHSKQPSNMGKCFTETLGTILPPNWIRYEMSLLCYGLSGSQRLNTESGEFQSPNYLESPFTFRRGVRLQHRHVSIWPRLWGPPSMAFGAPSLWILQQGLGAVLSQLSSSSR